MRTHPLLPTSGSQSTSKAPGVNSSRLLLTSRPRHRSADARASPSTFASRKRGGASEAQSEEKGGPDLGQTVAAQRGDKSADFVLGYRLDVVEVGRAVARHAFVDRQDDFRGDVTDRGRHRGDRHLTERVEDGVTSENDDRPPLVGCGEPVPADLASPHGSTQVCSRSQASNSPRPTGLRAYPSRCFCSRLRTRTRLNASRSASRAKADRLVPSLRTTRSTAVTSSSSSVI